MVAAYSYYTALSGSFAIASLYNVPLPYY